MKHSDKFKIGKGLGWEYIAPNYNPNFCYPTKLAKFNIRDKIAWLPTEHNKPAYSETGIDYFQFDYRHIGGDLWYAALPHEEEGVWVHVNQLPANHNEMLVINYWLLWESTYYNDIQYPNDNSVMYVCGDDPRGPVEYDGFDPNDFDDYYRYLQHYRDRLEDAKHFNDKREVEIVNDRLVEVENTPLHQLVCVVQFVDNNIDYFDAYTNREHLNIGTTETDETVGWFIFVPFVK